MKFKSLKAIFAGVILSVSCLANAGIITYSGDLTDGSLQTSGGLEYLDYQLFDTWDVDHLWTFDVNAGDNVTITARRLTDFDTVMLIWEGTETDTSAITSWGTDTLNMTLIGYADDELSPNIPSVIGCCGDPQYNGVAATTATWTVGVFALGGQQGVEHFYNVQATGSSVSVPEPSTLAIFALGMIGLASRRFKKQS